MAVLDTGMRPGLPRGGARTLPLRVLGDDRLAALAASGNGAAFGAIYERHHRALTRYCQSILMHPEDARDALQETMVKAMRALVAGAPPDAIRPWLFRIAHNEAISLLRRRRPHAGLEAAAAIPAAATGPVRERLSELVGDLRALPERQRCALLLRELCGLRYGEIAAVLETNEVAARRLVADGRAGLHRFDEGRALDCADVRRTLATGDGRARRARTLRAHVRDCRGCADFEAAVARRRLDLRCWCRRCPGWGCCHCLPVARPPAARASPSAPASSPRRALRASPRPCWSRWRAPAPSATSPPTSTSATGTVPRERVERVAPRSDRASAPARRAATAQPRVAPRRAVAAPRTTKRRGVAVAQRRTAALRGRAEPSSPSERFTARRRSAARKPAAAAPPTVATPKQQPAATTPVSAPATAPARNRPRPSPAPSTNAGSTRSAARNPIREYVEQVQQHVNEQLQTSLAGVQQQVSQALTGAQASTQATQQLLATLLAGRRP